MTGMSEIYTEGGGFGPFSTRSNMKTRGKGDKIGAKIGSKNRFITSPMLLLPCPQARLVHETLTRKTNL